MGIINTNVTIIVRFTTAALLNATHTSPHFTLSAGEATQLSCPRPPSRAL